MSLNASSEVVSRLGWHGDEADATFVLPDQVFGGKSGAEITYTGTMSDSPYRVSGSLDGWRERQTAAVAERPSNEDGA